MIHSVKLLILIIILYPSISFPCEKKIWSGGLWNLDLQFDISTYGHFEFCIGKDKLIENHNYLQVYWVEHRDYINSKKVKVSAERVYGYRLIDETELGLQIDETIEIIMGDVPSEYHLRNNRGQTRQLQLWEPSRIEIPSN